VVGVAVTAAASYPDVCFGEQCRFLFGDGPGDLSGPRLEELTEADMVAVDVDPLPRDPGLVWLTRDDLRSLAPDDRALSHVVHLALADPSEAAVAAFTEAHTETGPSAPALASWVDLRDRYNDFVRGAQLALTAFGGLLTLLAVASVAVLVGGRMADQTRRVGLLKAVGGTPGLVAVVLLAEYVALAVVAAGAGLALGWLVAPLLGEPGAGLVGSAGAPSLTLATVGLVTAVALGVAVLASAVSAVRAARTSTVDALADAARRPRRARWLIALSARLPVALLLGLRVAARRPRRVVLSVASIVVTVSGIVAVLGARAAMAADWESGAGLDPVADQANQVLLVITAMLVALAAVNAIVVTWAAALDSRHSSALARALGATPGQVSAGLSAAQVGPALVGAVLGIPGGLALWSGLADGDEATPAPGHLLAVVVGTALVVAGLTAVPALLATRRPAGAIRPAERP
jgi:ABC-type lipoprotein release transport system permease subunit